MGIPPLILSDTMAGRSLTFTKALEEVSALVEGKVTPRLVTLLDSIKDEKKVSLAVADPKLGTRGSSLIRVSRSFIDSLNWQAMLSTSFLASLLHLFPTLPLPICTEPFESTYHL